MAGKLDFLNQIYGEKFCTRVINKEKFNANKDLDKMLNDMKQDIGETHGFLYYEIADLLLEENPPKAVEKYITENIEDISKSLIAVALRYYRHPNRSKPLATFLEDSYVLETQDWEALEKECFDEPLKSDDEIDLFVSKIKETLDKMDGDKIDALLKFRFSSNPTPLEDATDKEAALLEAAMNELKSAAK